MQENIKSNEINSNIIFFVKCRFPQMDLNPVESTPTKSGERFVMLRSVRAFPIVVKRFFYIRKMESFLLSRALNFVRLQN
jgi:hypothetical protein